MKFLVLFVNTLGRLSFRQAELMSILEVQGLQDAPMKWCREKDETGEETPFMEIDLPSEESAKQLAARSVSIKGIFEPWGTGSSRAECFAAVDVYSKDRQAPYIAEGTTFKINVVSYGLALEEAERKEVIEECFEHVKFKGKVLMDRTRKGVRAGRGPRADNQFWYFEDRGTADTGQAHITRAPPHQVHFCREIALGQRYLLDQYELKKRDYLCSTSMTAENSFLVANFAHAAPGKLVFDPFCGSCSLLVSAAHFGAYTMGGDIDIRVIRGKEKDAPLPSHCRYARTLKDVAIGPLSNFDQYGLMRPLDIVRCDNANPVWRTPAVFDAVVGDPPYGVRAGARKTGSTKTAKPIPEEHRATHIPGTVPYDVKDVLIDLLDFAAKFLRTGGRLVYWVPTTTDYSQDDLPQHPSMRLLYDCEEVLSLRLSRRLITMHKVKELEEGERATCKMSEAGLEPAHDRFADKYYGLDGPRGEEGEDREDGGKKKRRKEKKQKPGSGGHETASLKEEGGGTAEGPGEGDTKAAASVRGQ